MSMGPLGPMGAAGTSYTQRGAEVERTAKDVADQGRAAESSDRGIAAEGVGETDEQEGVGDRDADGRRIWEVNERTVREDAQTEDAKDSPQSRDAGGERGNLLDLSG